MTQITDSRIKSALDATTLVELLRWRAVSQPEHLAFTFLTNGEEPQHHLTYSELDQQARAIAAQLQMLAAKGERVVLLYPPGLEYVAAFFGCLYAGAMAVPVYPPDPNRLNRTLPRFLAIADDAKPQVALTTAAILEMIKYFLPEIPQLQGVHWLATDRIAQPLAQEWQEPNVTANTIAFLQYTSGSTSTPKGVMVSHANLLANERLIQTGFHNTEQSVGVGWLPLYHDMGLIGNVIQPLYVGFPCILMSPLSFLERPARWLQTITRYRATASGGPNFAYDLCVRKITAEQKRDLDLSSWELAFNGAEPINPETMQRFSEAFKPYGFREEAFYPCYGLAEATLIVSGGAKASLPIIESVAAAALEQNLVDEGSKEKNCRQLVSSGQTFSDQKILIVDPVSLIECRPEQIGEIWVAGDSVAQGYWNRPQETSATFQAYLANTGAGPFLRTGDLGFFKNGELFVTGRLKDLIIIRGRNHYPQDIERTIENSHLLLRKGCSAVFSVTIDSEERLVIVAEVQSNVYQPTDNEEGRQSLNIDSIVKTIRQVIAAEHELQVYALILIKAGSIAKTSSGKIQRHACREAFLDGSLETVTTSLLQQIESNDGKYIDNIDLDKILSIDSPEREQYLQAYLVEQVARVLRINPSTLNPSQSLAALGLDSLNAIELKNQVAASLNVELAISDLLIGASIAQLTEQVLKRLVTREDEQYDRSSIPVSIARESIQEQELSYGQQALWFLQQLAPTNSAYSLCFAVRIISGLDTKALQRAFQTLIDRHPILRTTYPVHNGKPTQHIHKYIRLDFKEVKAIEWDDRELNLRMVEEAQRPFNLEQDSPLRLCLFTRATGERLLLLTVHHIAVDLWSLVVLLNEFQELYPSVIMHTPMELPTLELQYTDYGLWQKEMLAGQEGEKLSAYWQRQLAGEIAVLTIPTDRPRPPVQTYQGNAHTFKLDEVLTEQLKGLAKDARTTLYTILLSVFYLLLHRYSSQEDILIGSPMAGRSKAGLENIIGYFVNTVVLRANLAGNRSFKDFLSYIYQIVLAALEHQDYPFPLLIERLHPQRDPSYSPLFQTMFILEKPHLLEALAPFVLGETGARINLAGLELESFGLPSRAAQFDLTLMMVETRNGLLGSFQFNTDLFDYTTIVRMTDHFQVLLRAVCQDVNQAIAHLPLLTEAEQHQLLMAGNATGAYWQDKCIHELFETQVALIPDKVAIVFENEQLTYRELNSRANKLA
ncbi:MAG: condensation domain-containing protein, partial [Acidobacteriota bacterium]